MSAHAYLAPDGEQWRADDGTGLLLALGVGEKDDLPAVHAALAGQGRVWEVVRRLFGVAGMYTALPEEMEPMSRDKVASRIGMPVEEIDADLLRARSILRVAGVLPEEHLPATAPAAPDGPAPLDESDDLDYESEGEAEAAEDPPAAAAEPVPDGVEISFLPPMSEGEIAALLGSFGWGSITDAMERHRVAARVRSLSGALRDPSRRHNAETIIDFEISQRSRRVLLAEMQEEYRTAFVPSDDDAPAEVRAARSAHEKRRVSLEESISKASKALLADAKSMESIASSLEEEERGMGEQKRAMVDVLTYLYEADAEYVRTRDTELIDGVFTADEVEWLWEPSGERPAQYRPDIAILASHSMLPENLYDPEYEPPVVRREVQRRLMRLVKSLAEDKVAENLESGLAGGAVETADSGEDDITAAAASLPASPLDDPIPEPGADGLGGEAGIADIPAAVPPTGEPGSPMLPGGRRAGRGGFVGR